MNYCQKNKISRLLFLDDMRFLCAVVLLALLG